MKNETAVAWLHRAGRDDVVRVYETFMADAHARGSKVRRSLWDILAGIRRVDGYAFPIFVEAAHYRGVQPPPDAIEAGIIPRAHRRSQVKKWGPKLRDLVKS